MIAQSRADGLARHRVRFSTMMDDVKPEADDSLAVGEMTIFLQRAVELAVDNAKDGQFPFGAVVVRDGIVVATGVNTARRDHDPTAHAEVAAIRHACRSLGVLHLTGARLFSSCEPCAMCHAVSVMAGVTRIVYAAPKEYVPDLGYPAPVDDTGLTVRMQEALRALNMDQVVHVPTEDADLPFRTFLAD